MASTQHVTTDLNTIDNKPNLSMWQIISMSFGFLGIQYGFGLQQANMSPIYRYLGAEESAIPGLWLAGPLTGLLLQPIIGALSDRSWSPRWGRRKPYVFIGAVVGSIAMIMMPNSTSVLMAACMLWLLDAGLNSAMEPFRAFVGDMLNSKQRPTGFSVQSFMVGFGQTLANLMPFILPIIGISLGVAKECDLLGNGIPNSVKYSFYFGAVAILATVFYTMYTTKEYPPENEDYKKPHVFTAEQQKNIKFWHLALTSAAAFLGAMFAVRLGYLGKINDALTNLKLSKWNELLPSLSNSGVNSKDLGEITASFQGYGGFMGRIEDASKALKCSGADTTAWAAQIEPFVKSCKDLDKSFVPTSEQTSQYVMHGLQNGLFWGVGIFAALYVLLRLGVFKEILASLSEMPPVMRQLWWVKFFTWYGLPLMWQYLSLSAAKYAFNAASPDANPVGFKAGSDWGSLCFAVFSITCFVISIFIPIIVQKIGSRRLTHAIFMVIGGLGFFSFMLSNDKYIYLIGMGIVGLAWGSIMSLPYLMLANSVPKEKMGVFIGIFNGFICVPQFIGMLTVPLFYKSLLGDDPRNALMLAGVCMVLAAVACFGVKEESGAVRT
jgi:Na+/melibiose symporter-like transporter